MLVRHRDRWHAGPAARLLASLTVLLCPVILSADKPTERIQVFFTAWAADGNPVSDLRADEVSIREGRTRREVSRLESPPRLPLRIAVLFDKSGSRKDQLPGKEGPGALLFLQSVLQFGDQALLVDVRDEARLVLDYSEKGKALEDAILSLAREEPRGSLALFDAIVAVCQKKLDLETGRKVIVLISDGSENSSRATLDEAVRTARRSGATIHAVVLEVGPKGIDRNVRRAMKTAEKLAAETGGLAVHVRDEAGFEPAYQRMAQAILAEYVVEYEVPRVRRKSGIFEKLQVEVSRPGITVVAPRLSSEK